MSLLSPIWAKMYQYEKDILYHSDEIRRLTSEKKEYWQDIVDEIYHDEDKASIAYQNWLKKHNY